MALLALPDEAIDLGQASLLIAREEYPDLRVGEYLARLDQLAMTIGGRLRGGEIFTSRIAHLNRVLFEEMGFRGNREDYFDPRNSFLNDVLDRRVGIPISLSTLYIEVGRRLGLPLAGVSFPGHFLVRYAGRDTTEDVLIDPFNRGRLLSGDECRRWLKEMYGDRLQFRPEFLRRARNREIIERMLTNLKQVYQSEPDFHRALRIQQLMLCLRPGDPEHLRDRGMLYYRLACLSQAAADLNAYLEAQPQAPDAPSIRRHLVKLRALSPVMN